MDTRASGLSSTIQTVTSGSSSSVMSGQAVSAASSSSSSTIDARIAMVASSLTSDSSSSSHATTSASQSSLQTNAQNPELQALCFFASLDKADKEIKLFARLILMIPEDTNIKEDVQMTTKRITHTLLFIHNINDKTKILSTVAEALKAGYNELGAIERYLAFENYMETEMDWEEAIKAARTTDEKSKKTIVDALSLPELKLLRIEVEKQIAAVDGGGADSKKSLEMLKTADQKTQNAVGQIWSAQIEERRKQDEEQSSCCML